MSRYLSLRTALTASLLAVVAGVSAFVFFAPARAAAALQQLASYSCSSNGACLTAKNDSSGKAIDAVAQTNAAVGARKLVNTNMNPNAPLSLYRGALMGQDLSTNQMDTNAGVSGRSDYGTGVAGVTSFDSSTNGFFQMGTLGLDISKTLNENSGIRGQSLLNKGVYGYAYGKPIPSCPGILRPNSGIGVFGESDTGQGVVGYGALAVAAISDSRRFPALAVFNQRRGELIGAWGGENNRSQVLSLDINGNLTVAGTVTQHGSAMTVRTTSHGDQVGTYAPQQSSPTMEDFGEAQLVEGRAVVRLDPRFASTIDGRYRYLVFLTAQGDSNGLYVAQKTADAFLVREHNETSNFRERRVSNVIFDYRIVAQPYGSVTERLPAYDGTRNEALTAGMLSSVKATLSHIVRLPRSEP